jgi:hypothetical protein
VTREIIRQHLQQQMVSFAHVVRLHELDDAAVARPSDGDDAARIDDAAAVRATASPAVFA